MCLLGIAGVLGLIFGVWLLFFPNNFVKISAKANKVVLDLDKKLIHFRIGIGVALIAMGLVCFFLIYYFSKC